MVETAQTAPYRLPFILDDVTNHKICNAFLSAYANKRLELSIAPFVNYRCVYEIPLTIAWDNITEQKLSTDQLFDKRYDLINTLWYWNPEFPYVTNVFRSWFIETMADMMFDFTYIGLRMKARSTKIPRHQPITKNKSAYESVLANATNQYAIHIPITCNNKGYGQLWINDRKVKTSNHAMLISDQSLYYSPAEKYFHGSIVAYGAIDTKKLIAQGERL